MLLENVSTITANVPLLILEQAVIMKYHNASLFWGNKNTKLNLLCEAIISMLNKKCTQIFLQIIWVDVSNIITHVFSRH